MSPLEAIDAVMRSNLHGAANAVALVVARHDGARGCFASVDTIAHEAGVTVRGTQKALRELEQLGVITVERPPGKTAVRRMAYPALQRIPPREVGSRKRPTPEPGAPLNQVRGEPDSGEPGSPPPPNQVHPTPELGSPKEAMKGQGEGVPPQPPGGGSPDPDQVAWLLAALGERVLTVTPDEAAAAMKARAATCSRRKRDLGASIAEARRRWPEVLAARRAAELRLLDSFELWRDAQADLSTLLDEPTLRGLWLDARAEGGLDPPDGAAVH